MTRTHDTTKPNIIIKIYISVRQLFLIVLTVLLLAAFPALAQEKLQVTSPVNWTDKAPPLSLKKLIPPHTTILRCGMAAYGQHAAMRWVVAWTDENVHVENGVIEVGVFFSRGPSFVREGERILGTFPKAYPIRLYWLHPQKKDIQVVQLGNVKTSVPYCIEGIGSWLVFPQGWKGPMIKQDFTFYEESGHYTSFEFPLVDKKSTLCVKRIHEYIPNEFEYERDEAIMKWDGKSWNE